MLTSLAVANYRSLRKLVIPLNRLNVIQGPNGSGKSNLYRSLRLLKEAALGGCVASIAREGGLSSVLWAGPEQPSKAVQRGDYPLQGTVPKGPVRLLLGFASEAFSYAVDFGLQAVGQESRLFLLDPHFKRESIWLGEVYRKRAALVERTRSVVQVRLDGWETVTRHLPSFESVLTHVSDPERASAALILREQLRSWRFYDSFRVDPQAPTRRPQIGTRTLALSNDGHDLAAAIETIIDQGGRDVLYEAVDDAFPGSTVEVRATEGWFRLFFHQPGLLRPLSQEELSDGTLRYLLLVAALLTPSPPHLLVLNEPESSLHPSLLPALARLMIKASEKAQLIVVSHSGALLQALGESPGINRLTLEKHHGETRVKGLRGLDEPPWEWPSR